MVVNIPLGSVNGSGVDLVCGRCRLFGTEVDFVGSSTFSVEDAMLGVEPKTEPPNTFLAVPNADPPNALLTACPLVDPNAPGAVEDSTSLLKPDPDANPVEVLGREPKVLVLGGGRAPLPNGELDAPN